MPYQTLIVEVRPSPMLLLGKSAALALAVLAIQQTGLPWDMQVISFVVLLVVAISLYRAQQIICLLLSAEGHLKVWNGEAWEQVALLPDSVVTPMLTLFRYQREGARFSSTCIMLPDCVDEVVFRKARIWLRWKGKPTGKLNLHYASSTSGRV